ncbi:MAG: DMT family transporter [Asticcacaulis sp.]|uniref:DMT family transporter n=1 Tax=Asticcacaulis sp. TaxID=1872648 RepID=UPI003F7B6ABC
MSTAAPSSLKAYALLTLTAFIWAGNSVAGKIGAGHIDPILLTSLRWGIAAVVIISLSLKQLKGDWPVIRRHGLKLFAFGASGFAIFNILLYTALTKTSVINVMIEQAAIPFVIFIGNFLLFRLKTTAAQLIGGALTLAGVIITATHGHPDGLLRLRLNAGDALMLLAVVIYAGYSVGLKWKPPLHWRSFLAIPCLAAAVTCVPFLIWRAASHPLPAPDLTGWLVAGYAAIFVALISSATWVGGIELIGANRAALFINLLPIFGILQSIFLLHAHLEGFHLIAIALVGGGIVLAEAQRLRQH